ncbi:uncharacterized protein N7473_009322 [Penicillium subrubescens]|uniref:Uncharacterized protein n=1 Tax=Penicillium subrubescens TaxID=1316194 RepID=A0A1Q5TAP3_9EURO|nr:uncharacterized protein N7473_009322 [Penicillium subrubescens]KAJ5886648.1 hypothetical protein N7473_009322 [Penicillium subrubescens]OKO97316.1 hypothetical protein PENSUB_10110 [Penicillium subrubescens]
MDSTTTMTESPVFLDQDKYREEVLGLSAEAETARAQQLLDDARALGLKVPEIEASAPLAASIASGMLDLSSPVLSSGSSTDRNSICEGSITPSHEPLSPSRLDDVVSSLSDITIASDRIKPGSTRSLASLSTRPTSYCSSESRAVLGSYGNNYETLSSTHRNSVLSVASADKKEKRRSSLKNAIGRIYFRKKRTPSSVLLPPNAQIMVTKDEAGIVDHVYLGTRRDRPSTSHDGDAVSSSTTESLSKLEIPIFDKEAVQRSLDDPELTELLERHRMERNRHVAFQEAALSILRQRHQTAISERQADNERLEEEKREKNFEDAIRMEERQLAVEMEQQREFDRAKQNSRTRIKHMEGYFRNASPPPSPAPGAQRSSESFSGSESTTPPARRFTRQQKEQLEQQYHDHETMDALHESRIKVLRDRQELRLRGAVARMERELNDMRVQHGKNVTALQAEHRIEETSMIQALDNKKVELRHRWDLEEAIMRKQLEVRNGHPYGPLPPISFSGLNNETRLGHEYS